MPAAITLKNLSDELYERLKARAKANRRTLNMEAVVCLEQVLIPTRATAQGHLARARQLRANQKPGKFKSADIARTINRGRT
jgi:plasmid stability protein